MAWNTQCSMATISPRHDQDDNLIGWQAIIRKRGFPSQTKTFRTKHYGPGYRVYFIQRGVEFLILCPQSDELKASLYAERLCQEAAQMQGDFPLITLSAGVAQMQPDMDSPEALLRAADQALLLAKRRGRSQIIIASTQRNPR